MPEIHAPDRAIAMARYIHHYTNDVGYPPTYREMGNAVGVSSTETVYRYLKILKSEGVVTWQKDKARTVRVINDDISF